MQKCVASIFYFPSVKMPRDLQGLKGTEFQPTSAAGESQTFFSLAIFPSEKRKHSNNFKVYLPLISSKLQTWFLKSCLCRNFETLLAEGTQLFLQRLITPNAAFCSTGGGGTMQTWEALKLDGIIFTHITKR